MKNRDNNEFEFTRYHKIFGIFFISSCVIFSGLLIYTSMTTEHTSEIKNLLNTITPDSLDEISILPANPDWKINLTLDTIKIIDDKTKSEITKILNQIDQEYSGRGLPKGWEADLILKLKSGRVLRFEVVDTHIGIVLFFTNTMLTPKYKCDGLKKIFERLSNYKEKAGGRDIKISHKK